MESTIVCLDNSEWARNGDYTPDRMGAQYDAANVIITHKMNDNPESTLGLLTMGGQGIRLLMSPSREDTEMYAVMHNLPIQGSCNIEAAIKVAMLALKHRENKAGGARVIAFVASPLKAEREKLISLGKAVKKNNISLDIISMGEVAQNEPLLSSLIEAANKREANCHLITVPPGLLPAEVIRASPLCGGLGDAGPQAAGGGGAGGDFSEFGGFDPNLDPEMALAMRVSMAEAHAAGAVAAPVGGAQGGAGGAPAPVGMDLDEEEMLLQQALQMSMMDDAPPSGPEPAAAPTTPAPTTPASIPPTPALALTPSSDLSALGITDPSFVSQLLAGLPGVDPNDPALIEAMRAMGALPPAPKKDDAK